MGKGSYFMVYFRGGATLEDADRELRSGNTVTRDGDGITVRSWNGNLLLPDGEPCRCPRCP